MRLTSALLAILGLISVTSVYFKSDALQACLIVTLFILLVWERRSRHLSEKKMWERINGDKRAK